MEFSSPVLKVTRWTSCHLAQVLILFGSSSVHRQQLLRETYIQCLIGISDNTSTRHHSSVTHTPQRQLASVIPSRPPNKGASEQWCSARGAVQRERPHHVVPFGRHLHGSLARSRATISPTEAVRRSMACRPSKPSPKFTPSSYQSKMKHLSRAVQESKYLSPLIYPSLPFCIQNLEAPTRALYALQVAT